MLNSVKTMRPISVFTKETQGFSTDDYPTDFFSFKQDVQEKRNNKILDIPPYEQ